jgi:uncharacterized protein
MLPSYKALIISTIKQMRVISNHNKLITKVLLLVFVIIANACIKKNQNNDNGSDKVNFDKQVLLVNLADNLIIPSYSAYRNYLDTLKTAFEEFSLSLTRDNLIKVRNKFDNCYQSYQRVSIYGLGPAEDVGLRVNSNIFPTDTSKIKSNISSGAYDLSTASNISAKGLPALDFLFYGNNQEDAALIQLFEDVKRKKYIKDLLSDLSAKINMVISVWQDSYRNTFINSLGTDVSSSMGFLINQLNYELDYLKNAKIATPLGLRSGGELKPGNCEAYYSAASTEYALATLKSIEDLYNGTSYTGNNGIGFDDYMIHLKIKYHDGTLNDAIKSQFALTKNKMQSIKEALAKQVISNKTPVEETYRELMKLIVLLKTDLPSSLGVVITYQDGDGD